MMLDHFYHVSDILGDPGADSHDEKISARDKMQASDKGGPVQEKLIILVWGP